MESARTRTRMLEVRVDHRHRDAEWVALAVVWFSDWRTVLHWPYVERQPNTLTRTCTNARVLRRGCMYYTQAFAQAYTCKPTCHRTGSLSVDPAGHVAQAPHHIILLTNKAHLITHAAAPRKIAIKRLNERFSESVAWYFVYSSHLCSAYLFFIMKKHCCF